MADKVFGVDFTNDTNPSGTFTVSVFNGSTLVDVALSDIYKAFGIAATRTLLDLISTTQGVILYHNGTNWVALSPGSAGQVLQTGGASANPSWLTLNFFDLHNYLANGGFSLAQRQAPATLTTYAANTYSADRWKTYAENASYQYQRQDGLGESGLTSQYFGSFKKITSTGKMFIYQIVEGKNSVPLRGKTVIFQVRMKASGSKTIRMGIFELATAGTIDTVPSPIVTAAGSNSTDPTMGTNVAIITAAQSKSVTTSMQNFSVSVTVPATSKNIICAVWTDSQFAANDILYIAEAGLYVSSEVQAWKPRIYAEELEFCQRYYSKNVPIETAPGDNVSLMRYAGFSWATVSIETQDIKFPVTMRIAPTITFYKRNGGGTNGQWSWYKPSTTAYVDATGTEIPGGNVITENSFSVNLITTGATETAGYIVQGGWVADAEL